uniref:Uncharacterized protein n=1 Tax=termite gut metagenome TaxID=433724 RepID=S0DEN2_9ZZZZ
MLTYYLSPIGFIVDDVYEQGKSFQGPDGYQDIWEYLLKEDAIGKVPEYASIRCVGSLDDRIISVNIVIGVDD